MTRLLLETLRARAGEWCPVTDLARALRAAPAEMDRAVEQLQGEGYRLERDAAAGYRFLGVGDRLISYEITRALDTQVIGRRVIVLQRTGSTNDDAWTEALSGAEDGTTIFAEAQSAGRGRMGRRWVSPPGSSLLMSVVVRPGFEVGQSNLLTVMSSVAVAQALQEYLHLPARIRWPNDIMIRERKVAGILVEGRSLATGAAFVLGIGLNVNVAADAFPPDLRDIATSLEIETGRTLSRIDLARAILASLDRWHRDLRFGDYGRIARCWRRLSSTLGERVMLIENGREFRGRVLDLSLEEGLIVRLDAGVTRIFHPSTVTLQQLANPGTRRP